MNSYNLGGALVIEHNESSDNRGSFVKLYNFEMYESFGVKFSPKETFYSISNRNVIRGIHFQTPPYDHGKLVTCLTGKALDVFVDLRKSSANYGKVFSLELNSSIKKSIFLPNGFGHGFLALEDNTMLLYQTSEGYKPSFDFGINPLTIDFEWPVVEAIISARDQSLQNFNSFVSMFT